MFSFYHDDDLPSEGHKSNRPISQYLYTKLNRHVPPLHVACYVFVDRNEASHWNKTRAVLQTTRITWIDSLSRNLREIIRGRGVPAISCPLRPPPCFPPLASYNFDALGIGCPSCTSSTSFSHAAQFICWVVRVRVEFWNGAPVQDA